MRKRTALPRFHARTTADRLAEVAGIAGLDPGDVRALHEGIPMDVADSLVENAVGVFALPLGVATNFRINGTDTVIPMVTEEPSVIAAASAGAKATDDIYASMGEPHLTGQIQVLEPAAGAVDIVRSREREIIDAANRSISEHMGVAALHAAMLDTTPPMMKVEIVVDTGDAMGANAVNTMCEEVAPMVECMTGGRALLRILTNHTPAAGFREPDSDAGSYWQDPAAIPLRTAHAEAFFDVDVAVAKDIVNAHRFALADASRAATGNKGVMNGITAVGMATGQDTRALEAGAHSYAATLPGGYGPLSMWEVRDGGLWGRLEVPLRVGVVGGLTTHHPAAAACIRMLGQPAGPERVAEAMAAAGLCCNFSALRALVTDGIQKGHMKLHARRRDRRAPGGG